MVLSACVGGVGGNGGGASAGDGGGSGGSIGDGGCSGRSSSDSSSCRGSFRFTIFYKWVEILTCVYDLNYAFNPRRVWKDMCMCCPEWRLYGVM